MDMLKYKAGDQVVLRNGVVATLTSVSPGAGLYPVRASLPKKAADSEGVHTILLTKEGKYWHDDLTPNKYDVVGEAPQVPVYEIGDEVQCINNEIGVVDRFREAEDYPMMVKFKDVNGQYTERSYTRTGRYINDKEESPRDIVGKAIKPSSPSVPYKVGDRVRLRNGDEGTVVTIRNGDNYAFPVVVNSGDDQYSYTVDGFYFSSGTSALDIISVIDDPKSLTAKIGDLVILRNGRRGRVTRMRNDAMYPFLVKFLDDESIETYTGRLKYMSDGETHHMDIIAVEPLVEDQEDDFDADDWFEVEDETTPEIDNMPDYEENAVIDPF